MQTIEYWEVTDSLDRDSKLIGNFSNEEAAKKVGDRVYRSVHKKTFTIFDTAEDFAEYTRAKLRERALAKLTPEEREALGVK